LSYLAAYFGGDMSQIKPHEFTTQVMMIKGPYHRLNHVPDRLFLIANGIDFGEGPKKIYFVNYSTN
jgi:hypothetical protein